MWQGVGAGGQRTVWIAATHCRCMLSLRSADGKVLGTFAVVSAPDGIAFAMGTLTENTQRQILNVKYEGYHYERKELLPRPKLS